MLIHHDVPALTIPAKLAIPPCRSLAQ
jgi:hypothetical protein